MCAHTHLYAWVHTQHIKCTGEPSLCCSWVFMGVGDGSRLHSQGMESLQC